MVKKTFTFLLVLSMSLLLGLPSLVFAGGGPSITLSIDQTAAAVGTNVKVTVTGSSLTDVYAYELLLRYDDKRLKLKNAVSMTEGFSVQPIVKDSTITIAHTKVGKGSGDNGTAVLATLTFTALAAGPAEISLTQTKLVNSKLDAVTVTGASQVTPMIGNAQALSDIAGHWAEAAIKRAVALGIVQGYADNRFLPNKPVTRGEFAVMLIRALNPAPGNTEALAFKDAAGVPAWAKDDVSSAVTAGWITGYDDHTFRASQPITRAELAAMSIRGLGWKADPALKLAFADTDAIAPWARPYAALAAERKLMGGRGHNLFAPNEVTTRAEAAAILVRMYDAKTTEGG